MSNRIIYKLKLFLPILGFQQYTISTILDRGLVIISIA